MDNNWLVGFIEGEGCFQIRVCTNKRSRLGLYFDPYFQISLAEKDYDVLKEIMDYLGFGKLQKQFLKKYRGYKHQDAYRFYVVGLTNCIKLKDIIYPIKWHTCKRKDFEKWCQFLDMSSKGLHLTIEGVKRISELRESMNVRATRRKEYYYLDKIMGIINNQKKRICKFCSKELSLESGSRRYCNQDCRTKYYNEYHIKRHHRVKKHNPNDFRICIICKDKFYRKDCNRSFERRLICLKEECNLKRNSLKTLKYYYKHKKT